MYLHILFKVLLLTYFLFILDITTLSPSVSVTYGGGNIPLAAATSTKVLMVPNHHQHQ